MTLTLEQRRDIEQLIEEEYRRFSRPSANAADQAHAARQVSALEAARNRFADGTFGRCISCGGDIELDRLIAHPTAVRCLPCQDDAERGGDDHPQA